MHPDSAYLYAETSTPKPYPSRDFVLDGVPSFDSWYRTKFDSDGNVRPYWRADTWTKMIDLPKSPSPDAGNA